MKSPDSNTANLPMMDDNEEMQYLRDQVAAKLKDPELQLKELKSTIRITQYRIDRQEILTKKIEQDKWKPDKVDKHQLLALTKNDVKLLKDYKKELESSISKLEKQVKS